MSKSSSVKTLVMQRINSAPAGEVWTPVDFLNLSTRDNVDKTLQRLLSKGVLRRIGRGLYDKPEINTLTGQPTTPDYRKVIDAVARRDQIRVLIDGITSANDLGLTNAVPGKVIVHTDSRVRPIQLGKLTITFKLTAASKLYWAGQPGMRIVQALYWLHDSLGGTSKIDQQRIQTKLIRFLQNSQHGSETRDDLQKGLHVVPTWMQKWIRELLAQSK